MSLKRIKKTKKCFIKAIQRSIFWIRLAISVEEEYRNSRGLQYINPELELEREDIIKHLEKAKIEITKKYEQYMKAINQTIECIK